MSAIPAAPQKSEGRDLLIDVAQDALDHEHARAERLDAKARGQMTLAGTWFAVVQAVAAVSLREGIPLGWLIAVGVAAAVAAGGLAIAMKKSAEVWKLQTTSGVGDKTIEAMVDVVDDPHFKDKMVVQYRHMLGVVQAINNKRAEALDDSTTAWWWALGLGLLEMAIALVARIVSA